MENGRYEKFKLRNKWLIKGVRTALNVYFIALSIICLIKIVYFMRQPLRFSYKSYLNYPFYEVEVYRDPTRHF